MGAALQRNQMADSYQAFRSQAADNQMTQGSVRLTPADIIYILQSTTPNQALAKELGVTRQAISNIRNGKAWANVAPQIPRIPIRERQTVRPDYLKKTRHCTNCTEWRHGECSFGFPEAIDEPTFAVGCDLYKRDPRNS